MMKVSKQGLAEIAAHEGIVLSPYLDSVGVWTIGLGHTKAAGSPDPQGADTITLKQAFEIFSCDIEKFESGVNREFEGCQLTQEQFDAAVSFHYNTGGIQRASWVKHVKNGDMTTARKSFMAWSKPKSIIERRQKECDLFFTGEYTSNGFAMVFPANKSGKVLWSEGKSMNVIDALKIT